MDVLPVAIVLLPLTGAVLATIAGEWSGGATRVIAVVTMAATTALAFTGLVAAVDEPVRHELGGWPPPLGIELVLDPLSGFMAVVIAVVGLAVAVFPPSAGYGVTPPRRFPLQGLVLLLLAGLFGVVLTGDLFNLFVFLEIYAIATYALVALGGPRATFASLRYLFFGTIGSGLYLLGIGFLYFLTGSLNMADVGDRLADVGSGPTVAAALALIVVGLALKMALFPLHVWLPEAHTYAPPAVAALLAAVQVKVAAYALVRILYGVFGLDFVTIDVPIADLLVWFGAGGILFGSAMAVTQVDFKRLLAYSTVAQLGYIGVGIGLGTTLAVAAALLHVLNHALMKSCLFLIAGGIYEQTGVKDVPRYAGLARRMPWMAGAFTVAALSMVGVPPTAGFFSKWYLLLGALDGGHVLVAVVIAASSLLTLWYFLRVIESMYSEGGEVDPAVAGAVEPRASVLGPVLLLAVGILVAGLANVPMMDEILRPAMSDLLASTP
jgi:multicomponent Na+:H+ antiporter subunit D